MWYKFEMAESLRVTSTGQISFVSREIVDDHTLERIERNAGEVPAEEVGIGEHVGGEFGRALVDADRNVDPVTSMPWYELVLRGVNTTTILAFERSLPRRRMIRGFQAEDVDESTEES